MKERNISKQELYDLLIKLNQHQFKVLYATIVHCWSNDRGFIDKRHFFNLWCELNYFCHVIDQSFPDPYDDRELIKDFCHAHPYYFINMLPINLISSLFAEHLNQRIDVLFNFIQLIYKQDHLSALSYLIDELNLDNYTASQLVENIEEHIKEFS